MIPTWTYFFLIQLRCLTCVGFFSKSNVFARVFSSFSSRFPEFNLYVSISIPGVDPGFGIGGGAWVGEGSGDLLRSPSGPGKSPSRGSRETNPHPRKLWGFEELQTFIWTTILNQPHHFYQTKQTLLWVLILSDNC